MPSDRRPVTDAMSGRVKYPSRKVGGVALDAWVLAGAGRVTAWMCGTAPR